jgi:CO/xanthine dehydrogenase FAD-binding subunit
MADGVRTFLRPRTLDEALAALAAEAAHPPADPLDRLTPMAGATDLYPAAAVRQAWFQPSPRAILDLSAIAGLRGLEGSAQGLRIGALTTWSDVLAAPLPPAFDALRQAARQVGGVQIQNRGTLAGNLCNASPAADGAPPLLALDAEVELRSAAGGRRLPLGAFLRGNRRTALAPGELVTAIHVPRPAETERSAFLKLGARAYLVISIASVAANVATDGRGRIVRARIAVGACSAVPQRLPALEARLVGAPPGEAARLVADEHLASLSPIDDVRASAAFRRDAAITLVRRALDGLAGEGRAAA